MRATDYYELYHNDFKNAQTEDEKIEIVKKIFIDFSIESGELIKKRNIQFDRAVPALISEMNDKWNCLSRIFTKKDGISYLKEDGFKIYFDTQLKV